MPARPWDAIALSRIQAPESVRADFQAARENPCLSCETSPCCWYLPLQTVEPTTYLDLDNLYKLTLFDRIELGLSPEGTWSVYYRYPCRFLDRESHMCSVHATDMQPKICVYYKPYGCWYRRVLVGPTGDEFARVDHRRFREIAALYRFDENRRVVATPPWEQVRAVLADVLDAEIAEGLPAGPSAEVVVRDLALTGPPVAGAARADLLDVLQDPCDDCAAPCCGYLSFPLAQPSTFTSFDYVRFALGFPGIELGVADDTWWLVVESRCRHLDSETARCTVYGTAERPLACDYYNQWSCTWKNEFTRPVPKGFARLRFEHLTMLAAMIDFDESGGVSRLPTVDEVQQALILTWRDLITAAAADPEGNGGLPVVDALAPTPGSEAWHLAMGA